MTWYLGEVYIWRRALFLQERAAVPFSAALLRYFNVIGADPSGRMGPHLKFEANARFPRIADAAYDVALGARSELRVMGADFPTKDGTALRDYIHVSDLADAHVLLMYALRGNELLYYNVGNGQPYSVLEIVEVVKRVSGRPLPVKMSPARPGDPHTLYTDPKKIEYEIGWRPKCAEIISPRLISEITVCFVSRRGGLVAEGTFLIWQGRGHRADDPPWVGLARRALRQPARALRRPANALGRRIHLRERHGAAAQGQPPHRDRRRRADGPLRGVAADGAGVRREIAAYL